MDQGTELAQNTPLPTRPAKQKWTTDRVDQITLLWNQGHSAAIIAKQMSTTRNAIIGKAHRLDLPSRKREAHGDSVLTQSLRRAPKMKKTRTISRPKASKPPTFNPVAPLDPLNKGALISELEWASGKPSTCRAILSGVGEKTMYCNKPTVKGESYCAGHCLLHYNAWNVAAE